MVLVDTSRCPLRGLLATTPSTFSGEASDSSFANTSSISISVSSEKTESQRSSIELLRLIAGFEAPDEEGCRTPHGTGKERALSTGNLGIAVGPVWDPRDSFRTAHPDDLWRFTSRMLLSATRRRRLIRRRSPPERANWGRTLTFSLAACTTLCTEGGA